MRSLFRIQISIDMYRYPKLDDDDDDDDDDFLNKTNRMEL